LRATNANGSDVVERYHPAITYNNSSAQVVSIVGAKFLNNYTINNTPISGTGVGIFSLSTYFPILY
jgi:hypothetical protein